MKADPMNTTLHTPELEQAAARWAADMLSHELAFYAEHQPERLARLRQENPNVEREFIEKKTAIARETITEILNPSDVILARVCTGMFHPSNPSTRRLFEVATGISLPNTVNGTRQTVAAYFGEHLTRFIDKQNAEKRLEELARKQKEQQAEESRLAKIRDDIRNERDVDGADLVEFARSIGIEIHPRTAGTVLKRLVSFRGSSARITGKSLPDNVWRLIRDVQNAIAEPVQA
jgi:hypothetical protein